MQAVAQHNPVPVTPQTPLAHWLLEAQLVPGAPPPPELDEPEPLPLEPDELLELELLPPELEPEELLPELDEELVPELEEELLLAPELLLLEVVVCSGQVQSEELRSQVEPTAVHSSVTPLLVSSQKSATWQVPTSAAPGFCSQ